MTIIKYMLALTAALAAIVAHAGDSAPFLLDTAEGTRIAREVETIAYSTAWNGDATVRVAADGTTLKEASAPVSGDVIWNAAQAGVGCHTLTHTSGGETLTAQFKVIPTLSVSNVMFRQRYPWNGLVDIDCTVNCSDPTTNISLYVSAKDASANKPLAVRSVWLESDTTQTNALSVKSGTHRLVWDAGKDNTNFVGDAVTVEVQAYVGPLYLIVDLSGGKDAASYPIRLSTAGPDLASDTCRTTELWLRLILPGAFVMGSPSTELGRQSNEIQHPVTISKPFYMGIFEVTQKQYQLVTGATPSYYRGDTRPVEQVSYDDIRGARVGANWPSHGQVDADSFLGKIRARTALNIDLPTEAQWEYACRAGTATALNNGKNLENANQDSALFEVGRYGYNSGRYGLSDEKGGYSYHTKVGSYAPNAWGLYDMHGNVWEWCLDWYGNYETSEQIDPSGVSSGVGRAQRGGSYYNYAYFCRSAYRLGEKGYPSSYIYDIGFRLCCPAGQ